MSATVAQNVVPVDITVNGVEHHAEVEPRQLLVHFLRETLGLTGTHVGCDTSSCGACTIHLDGKAVKSCTVLTAQADGASITKDVTATIRKQLETGRERVELQNVALLGALDEDDNGCYVGMLIKSASAGGMRTRLCVFANAILNGRLVYLYIFSDTVDEDNVKRLLADRKAAAKAHVEANRRPL